MSKPKEYTVSFMPFDTLQYDYVVEAGSEKEAMDKVDQGDWEDNDIVEKKLIDRMTVEAEKYE